MRYARVTVNRRVESVLTVEEGTELPQDQLYAVLTEDAFYTLVRNPQLMSQVTVNRDGTLAFPSTLISTEAQKEMSSGKMRRITDLASADVVFDGTNCFLQASVEMAKFTIVDNAGVPVLTFQVDTPFPVIFPEGGELFCLSNNVSTYYVEGWS